MKRNTITDLSELKEFRNKSYNLKQINYNPDNHIGIWEVYGVDNKICGYEIVRGVLTLDNNFNTYWTYPTEEQFGDYGWYVGSYNRAIDKYNQILEQC